MSWEKSQKDFRTLALYFFPRLHRALPRFLQYTNLARTYATGAHSTSVRGILFERNTLLLYYAQQNHSPSLSGPRHSAVNFGQTAIRPESTQRLNADEGSVCILHEMHLFLCPIMIASPIRALEDPSSFLSFLVMELLSRFKRKTKSNFTVVSTRPPRRLPTTKLELCRATKDCKPSK